MNITVTPKEKKLLLDIHNSEYQDGPRADNHIWMDYVVNTKSHGGILTSLQKKGLVDFKLVAMNKSDNAQNGITDSTIWLTEAGAEVALYHAKRI